MPNKILWFSRGKGRGHAVPDFAIVRRLRQEINASVQFASYACGAIALRECGEEIIDLCLPEANSYTETLGRAWREIDRIRPDVVVSHEEFGALPAARMLGVKSIYISDWMPGPGSIAAEAIGYADNIVIWEHPGVFFFPYQLRCKPEFVGPFARRGAYGRGDANIIRTRLGIDQEAFLLLVVPGSFVGEEKAPLAPLVLSAYGLLPERKNMIWVAGQDVHHLRRISSSINGVTVLDTASDMHALLAACNVMIGRGTRATLIEAASMGTPTITLSHGVNPTDDYLASRIGSNLSLQASALGASDLCRYLLEMQAKSFTPLKCLDDLTAAQVLARRIRDLCDLGNAGAAPVNNKDTAAIDGTAHER